MTDKCTPSLSLASIAKVALNAAAQRRGGGIGGQMITDWTCATCGREGTHGSTATPLVCTPCEKELRRLAGGGLMGQGSPRRRGVPHGAHRPEYEEKARRFCEEWVDNEEEREDAWHDLEAMQAQAYADGYDTARARRTEHDSPAGASGTTGTPAAKDVRFVQGEPSSEEKFARAIEAMQKADDERIAELARGEYSGAKYPHDNPHLVAMVNEMPIEELRTALLRVIAKKDAAELALVQRSANAKTAPHDEHVRRARAFFERNGIAMDDPDDHAEVERELALMLDEAYDLGTDVRPLADGKEEKK